MELIAEKLCVSKRTVYDWFKLWNGEGPEGILIKKHLGRNPLLKPQEKENFIEDILESPMNIGYETSTWTLKVMAKHLEKCYGKTMYLSGIYRMLKN